MSEACTREPEKTGGKRRPKRLILPSAERLNELFSYDPETGVLSRKVAYHYRQKIGPVLTKQWDGYLVVRIGGPYFAQHRVVWKMMTGREPPDFIDHENTDVSDNRFANLREADSFSNPWNSAQRSNNTSGYRGVRFCKKAKKWRAIIGHRGNQEVLGYFDDIEAAVAAYQSRAREIAGPFYRDPTTARTPIRRPRK